MKAIYKITNKNDNKFYVGSAQDLQRRWRKHKESLRANRHHNKHLQNDWNKHGEEAFRFEILEEIKEDHELIEAEQKWLDLTLACDRTIGYNIEPTAGSRLGRKQTEATKKKISEAFSGEKHPFYGKTLSKEHREKISRSNKGKIAWNKGKKLSPLSEETKRKMSQKLSGRPVSNETREKISKSLKGHQVSEETREKLRKANLGREVKKETREKLRKSLSGEKAPSAVMTWEKVRELRKLRKENQLSSVKLAKMFGISQSAAYNIIKHKTWRE
jgi:group I intron endonuclease